MSNEKCLFDAGRASGFGYTKYDVQAQLQHLGRALPYFKFDEARDHLVRAAGMAGADPWAIPERLCGASIREALQVARDLGLRPQRRTPTNLSKRLLEIAGEMTEQTDLSQIAAVLAGLGRRVPDLSTHAYVDEEILELLTPTD